MDKEIIEKLIEENLTIPQIAERLNKSPSSVGRLLKKFGLKTKRHFNYQPNAKIKKCRYCGKSYSCEFFEIANTINGIEYRRNKCNKCYMEMKQKRRVKMRIWFQDYKKTLKCKNCGNSDFRVLDFHHNGIKEKESEVSTWASNGRRSIENIKKEIEKCDVLCANCHRILHYEERSEKQGIA